MLVQFVQQPRTEKHPGNVVSAQKGNATTTVIQFKQRAAIARNSHKTDKYSAHSCYKLFFCSKKF